MLATGFPYDRRQFPDVLARWGRFIHAAQAVRRDGAAALDLAYVACGRFDGFWEAQLSPWDVAAGLLLVTEAGGAVTHFDGQPYRLGRPDLVASNGAIHRAMLEVTNSL
jgi:myo-inositol-1(or 4)-monophosphatase